MINTHINLDTKHDQRVIISQFATTDYYGCEIKGKAEINAIVD